MKRQGRRNVRNEVGGARPLSMSSKTCDELSHGWIDGKTGGCDWVRAQGRCDGYGTNDLQAWLSVGQPVRLVEQKGFPAFLPPKTWF